MNKLQASMYHVADQCGQRATERKRGAHRRAPRPMDAGQRVSGGGVARAWRRGQNYGIGLKEETTPTTLAGEKSAPYSIGTTSSLLSVIFCLVCGQKAPPWRKRVVGSFERSASAKTIHPGHALATHCEQGAGAGHGSVSLISFADTSQPLSHVRQLDPPHLHECPPRGGTAWPTRDGG